MKIRILTLLAILGVAAPVVSQAAVSHTTFYSIDSVEASFDDFETLLKNAYAFYTQKKYDEALAACAKATVLRPEDHRPHTIAGLAYMAQWKMKSASESFAKAILCSPSNGRLHYMRARSDRFRNAKNEGLVSVRKAIELEPTYADAYLLLGDLLGMGSGDNNGQIDAYRKAIELQPNLLETYSQLGMVLAGSKDEKGAEEVYRKAIEIDPKKMASRFDLGRLLVKQGRLKEARAVWEERSSDEDRTFPNFITLLERGEKMERAKADLAQKPNDPDALLQMGLMVMDGESWVVDGRQERAIEYFRKALALKPGFAQAQFAIVKAYIEIADTFKDKNKNVDDELAKLQKLDPKLAEQAAGLRKTYKGAITGTPVKIDQ